MRFVQPKFRLIKYTANCSRSGKYISAFKYIRLYYVGRNFRLTKLYLEIELERFYLLKAIDQGLGPE
jgi:hypothetical protein